MKLLAVLCFLVAVTAAPPPNENYSNNAVKITRYDNDNIGLGNYKFFFEQSDGTRAEQQGEVRNEGREDESLAVKGTFSWVGPDGVTYRVIYVADENGYQPEIEQGPGGGVPPAIVASLLG